MKININDKIGPIVERQYQVAQGDVEGLPLPKFNKYSICNLRGGIGKTTLSFNLTYLAGEVLAVDTCPQGNLSYYFDNNYYTNATVNVNDLILPYIIPGLGKPSRVAYRISATNNFFNSPGHTNAYYIPSSEDLYMLPAQMSTAISQASGLPSPSRENAIMSILTSLKTEITREMKESELTRCLVDTSPFFSGATHLAWHATDALIIPVRTDQQSINSLNLLLKVLSDPSSEFRKSLPADFPTPKIQMIVLTHCAWSTVKGARNKPNQQTLIYLNKLQDIVNRNIKHFTTDDPSNHIFLLDDFLGSGRISSALSKPVMQLEPGESKIINRVKTTVNDSVEKCKNQLQFISNSIW
ncbi:ParA family protein [Schinkia azotoformans]|uniref:ParA family protein n=1 Tax=Schinkia azotoformans TaxID=1454 RepID=UPI002E22DBAE|nr:ParA family protein [Schinkia azotoformans]